MEHRTKYLDRTIHRILNFYSYDLSPVSRLLDRNSLDAIQVEMLISKFNLRSI
jgi:hypothetical protein